MWEGYPESLDENVFIFFFYVKLNIVFDQKIVTLNAFKCHIKQIKTKKIPEMSLSKSLRGKKNVNSLRLQ